MQITNVYIHENHIRDIREGGQLKVMRRTTYRHIVEELLCHALSNVGICSGLLIPDTKLGGRIAISEVFNEQTTSILFGRVQT